MNQFAFATDKGIMFVRFTHNPNNTYKLEEAEPVHQKDFNMRSLMRCSSEIYMHTAKGDKNIYFYDREKKGIIKAIENPSGSEYASPLQPIPSTVFALMRDDEG
jgi:hypothetical protein